MIFGSWPHHLMLPFKLSYLITCGITPQSQPQTTRLWSNTSKQGICIQAWIFPSSWILNIDYVLLSYYVLWVKVCTNRIVLSKDFQLLPWGVSLFTIKACFFTGDVRSDGVGWRDVESQNRPPQDWVDCVSAGPAVFSFLLASARPRVSCSLFPLLLHTKICSQFPSTLELKDLKNSLECESPQGA